MYFDTDQSGEIPLDSFHELKMKNGLTSMDFWISSPGLKNHPT
jgi:hypothetical protein